ncbi:MAG TPA: type II toxin-antitoxin system Phd/YefM family antitoxin [Caldilineae bacterium]|nr:type II toxin-antitoxin system Phd/YefM family antitoxin [Caldilineae bacterium]
MLRTIEATIDKEGTVDLLETVKLETSHRAIVTILDERVALNSSRPFGLCAGEFAVPDDFDEPLPEDILSSFEGS